MADKIVQQKLSPYERTPRKRDTDEEFADGSPMIVGISKQLNSVIPGKHAASKTVSLRTPAKDRQSFLPELKQLKTPMQK